MVGNSLVGGSLELTESVDRQSVCQWQQNPFSSPGSILTPSCVDSLRDSAGGTGVAGDQEALLKQIFRDLQDMGLISSTRTLQPMKRGPSNAPILHVDPLHRSRIYYWLDHYEFETDGLRYALLHEERHLGGGHLNGIAYGASLVGWSCFFLYLALTGHLQQSPWPLLYLLLPVAVYYSALPFLVISEMRSDLWAATTLKSRFSVARPSQILARALDFPPPKMTPTERFLRRVLHADPHPSKKRRIELVAKKVDDNEG